MDSVVSKILDAVKKSHNDTLFFEELYSQDSDYGKNQFLMFIKPEILVDAPSIKTEEMVRLVFDKVSAFGLKVHNIKALGAKYLDENDIIAQHYGVINKLANNAKETLSEAAKEKFKEFYGKSVEECKILGGLEFIRAYREFTPYTLDILWQQQVSKKLAGGTYIEEIKLDDETVHLINGFHGRQIHHFTQSGRAIIVVTVSGDTEWEKVRDDMIGNTFPERANPESIRGTFYARKEAYGLADVSIANNGIHLSAGPVEGLIELIRYNSDFSSNGRVKTVKDFAFGQKLLDVFGEDKTAKILENPNLEVDGKSVSVFDLTELKNADESIELLQKYMR